MDSQRLPQPGELVEVRQRRYLVEQVVPDRVGKNHIVKLACVDDDAQGQKVDVFWEHEYDRKVKEKEDWSKIAERGFDSPEMFSAFFHALRWNCVTSTDPKLFQAPFRAGISIDEYQLEPLRRALSMPRVNLFIADDVGLGKTIEAGLIMREMLLRRKIDFIVVSAPPSMLLQWQSELETRFGLPFQIIDREYIYNVRRERGFAVNPWQTHSRFLISHRLLIDEKYMADLRVALSPFRANSLFILDEAHHAAPSSGAKYAVDSDTTRYVTEFSRYFEHRLFLSATPHNGHSNSFSTLLSILDPHRFTKGATLIKENTKKVIVRRLKDDLRGIGVLGFPERKVVAYDIDGLPDAAPELSLAKLLDEYSSLRRERLSGLSKLEQSSANLVLINLQHRLLSSIEAFYVTFRKHRQAVLNQNPNSTPYAEAEIELENIPNDLVQAPLWSEDEKAELSEEEISAETEAQVSRISSAAERAAKAKISKAEIDALNEIERISATARFEPDGKIKKLLEWISKEMCPFVSDKRQPKKWSDTKLIIFTEWDDTKRFIKEQIESAIEGSEEFEERIAIYHGPTSLKKREEIKAAFNSHPSKSPLRILICTDAAREGLNLQSHCSNLFHFDIPWNPSRMEQRNGRIDRKLQPASTVYCNYFFYKQRPEDRVLKTIVEKAKRIIEELGSMSPIVESKIAKALGGGIIRNGVDRTVAEINNADLSAEHKQQLKDELEVARERQSEIRENLLELGKLKNKSEEWLGFKKSDFRAAISSGLKLIGAEPLKEIKVAGKAAFEFPRLDIQESTSWASTLDTLRGPNKDDLRIAEWRKTAAIRPLVFEDMGVLDDSMVHLHLEHRVSQRLLGRFLSQGFTHHDLSRACLGLTEDGLRRVVLLGKVSLFGTRADRLHEAIIPITAEWVPLSKRKGALKPFGRAGEETTLELLEKALSNAGSHKVPARTLADLKATVAQDTNDLLAHLAEKANDAIEDAKNKLVQRGKKEALDLKEVISQQITRVEKDIQKSREGVQGVFEIFLEAEQIQVNRKSWEKRLVELREERELEPKRVEERYEIKATRIEPVGIVYLWPMASDPS